MSSRAGRPDPAPRELARQIRALPAPLYEFSVFDGRTVRRVWRARQALGAVGWLRHRNARGGHVHVRPATTACVLADALCAEALAAMRADGLVPATVLETAPASFQAWLRLGREVEPKLAACVARILAERYGGDPARADGRRAGRAAGFTNRTAELRGADGRYPRVSLVEARGRVARKADDLVAAAAERLARRDTERVARRGNGGGGRAKDPRAFLAREAARMGKRHGASTDWSRAFAAAARRMALAGYVRSEVAAALAASPELRRCRPGGVEEYAERTAAWAFGAVRRRPR